MRRLVDRSTQNMADTLVSRIRHLVGSSAPTVSPDVGFLKQVEEPKAGPRGESAIDWEKYRGYREVTAYPTAFEEGRFSLEALREAAPEGDVLFRGWPFIYVDPRGEATYVVGDALETVLSLGDVQGHDQFEMWQLRRSGLLFHRTLMPEQGDARIREQHGEVLDFIETIYHVSEAVASLWRVYTKLGVPEEEDMTFDFNYTGCSGRRLVILDPHRRGIHGNVISRADEVRASQTLPLREWRASDAQVASEMCAEIFQQFNWDQPNRAGIEKVVSDFIGKPVIATAAIVSR